MYPWFKTCATENNTEQDNGKMERVKVQCKKAIVIPADEKIVLNGYTRKVPTGIGVPILVEPPTQSTLPTGLFSCSYVMSSPRPTSSNQAEEHKVSQPSSTFAECMATGSSNHENTITFDFSDSPLPEEWKEQITTNLNSIPEVFAMSDLAMVTQLQSSTRYESLIQHYSSRGQGPFTHHTMKL